MRTLNFPFVGGLLTLIGTIVALLVDVIASTHAELHGGGGGYKPVGKKEEDDEEEEIDGVED